MSAAHRQFLEDMLRDSLTLEGSNEPGQAFDKLARGIEARLPDYPGPTQAEKARELFGRLVQRETVWQVLVTEARGVRSFTWELAGYVQRDLPSEAAQLRKHGDHLLKAAEGEDRAEAGLALAALFTLFRNKRFHGYPAFSGRNFRVARAARSFLALVRACLEQELATPGP